MDNSKLNTLRFLLCLRESINLEIDISNILSENDKYKVKNYIQNEATDYEILYYSISKSFPKQKHNIVIESELMEAIKYYLQEEYVDLNNNCDCLNENILDSLIESLKPLGAEGLTSKGIILEHLINSNILVNLINEEWEDVRNSKPKPKTEPKEKEWEDVPKNKPESIPEKNKKPESGSKALEILAKAGKGVALTVAVATILYGAYQTYKRYFSKAARACKGKTGAARDACVENYRTNAIKAQINDIKKAKSACKLNAKPKQCQDKLQAKINKLNLKLNS